MESLKTYYERQSSGRYSVNGEVSDWVKVPYNEARYGRSNGFPCGSSVCSNSWNLISDALTAWVADQHAQGRTDAQITADLRSYDQWDRYDYDGDGNFNEPDGYIDHFQIVHAGGDQADGDPYQGEDAIWSHRWYAFQGGIGNDGPSYNQVGGTQIGTTGIWVGDYTMQPENGGVSVFAHEYGHDLGLPDHYDTAGGPDNAVNWWTLMAQSRASARHDVGIGTRPADLGAWDKLQLGWLDYEVVPAGTKRTLQLGPHEYNSRQRARRRRATAAEGRSRAASSTAVRRGRRRGGAARATTCTNTLSPDVTLPGRARIPDLPGQLRHRGLRTRPVRLRVRRGERRLRLEVNPRFDRDACGGQRHRRHERRLEGRDVRPVGVRRDHDRAAVPLHDRRRSRGARVLRRRHRRHRRWRDRLQRRCRGRRRRLDH